jgi:hypothetical protein
MDSLRAPDIFVKMKLVSAINPVQYEIALKSHSNIEISAWEG